MSLKIYKASAGSGKTYQLALEYICLALAPDMPLAFSHILAVTFTNKATGEMKDRILGYLYDLAFIGHERDFGLQVCSRLHLAPQEVARRAAAAIASIIHNYDLFRVETIDAFFQSLLSGLAYELGLSRRFSVDLDVANTVSRAVDRLLQTAGANAGSMQRVVYPVQLFMEEKMEEGKGWGISRDLKQFAANNLFCEAYLKNEDRLTSFFRDKKGVALFKQKLHKAANDCRSKLSVLSKNLADCLAMHEGTEGVNKRTWGSICTYARNLSEEKFEKEPSLTVLKVASDPTELLTAKYKQAGGLVLKAAEDISAILQEIERYRPIGVFMIHTVSLTLQKLMPLCLLNEVGGEVSAINKETDTFMLAKTPDFFNKVVEQNDSSFVFERTGTTFRHVMIDEFQDTSRMQWDIFKRLLLENLSQGEDNLIVGDIKQSIYRWRGGDWKILHGLKEEVGRLGEIEERSLDTNYRSREVVVNFNNSFFMHAAAQLDTLNASDHFDDSHLVEDIYQDVVQKVKPKGSEGGYVRLSLLDKEVDEMEIMQSLHDEICRLHEEAGIPFGQMVILVRYNSEAVKIIDYFTAHHPSEIPLTSDEAFKLSASPAVMLLVSALKYLARPQEDTASWALCLRMAEELEKACASPIRPDKEWLLERREELLAMPLYELCQRLIRHLGLPQAERHDCGQSSYLFYFLDHVLTFLDEHASVLSDFIDYWDEVLVGKSISANVHDAIHIMTIHKSKGLQKHTVLVPFCNWSLDSDRIDDILWCETRSLGSPFDQLPLVPVNQGASSKVKTSAFQEAYGSEHLDQRIDSLNELYVALTRAESNLLVWSKTPKVRSANSVKVLFDSFVPTSGGEENGDAFIYGVLDTYRTKPSASSGNPLLTSPSMLQTTRLAARDSSVKFRQSNEAAQFVGSLDSEDDESGDSTRAEYILRGNVLHYILSMVKSVDDLPRAMANARKRGLFTTAEEEDELRNCLEERLGDPVASHWFDTSWQVLAECDILTPLPAGEVMQSRPDRVMYGDNKVIVVDYKTGRYHKTYEEQVGGYMHALRQMGNPNVQGFLWFLTTGEIREVKR